MQRSSLSAPVYPTQRRALGFACPVSRPFATLSSGRILSRGGRDKKRSRLNQRPLETALPQLLPPISRRAQLRFYWKPGKKLFSDPAELLFRLALLGIEQF